MTRKQGLKVRDVSKEHFSSGVNLNEPKFSRIVVRIIECKQLLASDVETGKSDPICFVWCGFKDEHPTIQELLGEGTNNNKPPATTGTQGDKVEGGENQNHEGELLPKQVEESNHNVLHTSVCYTTTDPIWNEDVMFPIDPEEIDQL